MVTVVVAIITLAMILSTVVTSDLLAESKKDRANSLEKTTSMFVAYPFLISAPKLEHTVSEK